MAMEKIVVAQSGITAGQMKDFWSKAAVGIIDGEIFGFFLDNPKKYHPGTTLARATKILGAEQVISYEQSAKIFGRTIAEPGHILFSAKALKECAAINTSAANQNKYFKDCWLLIYLFDFSLKEMLESRQVFFKDLCGSKIVPAEKFPSYNVLEEKPPAGYYLINLQWFKPKGHIYNGWYGFEEAIKIYCQQNTLVKAHSAAIAQLFYILTALDYKQKPSAVSCNNGEKVSEREFLSLQYVPETVGYGHYSKIGVWLDTMDIKENYSSVKTILMKAPDIILKED